MGLIGEKGKGIMNNKKNLKMKPVGSEYMEQYNALLRYVFQVTEQELSSIGWQEREIMSIIYRQILPPEQRLLLPGSRLKLTQTH